MSKKISELPKFTGQVPSIADFPVSVSGTTYRADPSQFATGGKSLIGTTTGNDTTEAIKIGNLTIEDLSGDQFQLSLLTFSNQLNKSIGFNSDPTLDFYVGRTFVNSGIENYFTIVKENNETEIQDISVLTIPNLKNYNQDSSTYSQKVMKAVVTVPFATYPDFPTTGLAGVVYEAVDSQLQYVWQNNDYQVIGGGGVPYTGAIADVDLGTHVLTANIGNFAGSGSFGFADSGSTLNVNVGGSTSFRVSGSGSDNLIELITPLAYIYRLEGSAKFGINTSTPTVALDVVGEFKLENATKGAGKVLTSDADGLATWEAPFLNADNTATVFGQPLNQAGVDIVAITAQVTEVTNKRYQSDNQFAFNDATSSIQTQLDSKVSSVKTINGAPLVGAGNIVIPIGFNSIRGNFSASATAQTSFTVTFGGTQPNTTYFVGISPLNALTATQNFIMTKTTTTFTVTFLTGLTGSVLFDWVLHQ